MSSTVYARGPELADLDRAAPPPPPYCGCRSCGRAAVATCDAVTAAGRVCDAPVCDGCRRVCASVVRVIAGRSVVDTLDLCPDHAAEGR